MWTALVVSYALQESEMLTLFLCSQLWKRLQGLCCQICLVRTTLSLKSKRHDVNEQLQWRFLDNRGLWECYLKVMFWLVDLNWLVNIWPQHWRRPARISIRDRQFCINVSARGVLRTWGKFYASSTVSHFSVTSRVPCYSSATLWVKADFNTLLSLRLE